MLEVISLYSRGYGLTWYPLGKGVYELFRIDRVSLRSGHIENKKDDSLHDITYLSFSNTER